MHYCPSYTQHDKISILLASKNISNGFIELAKVKIFIVMTLFQSDK